MTSYDKDLPTKFRDILKAKTHWVIACISADMVEVGGKLLRLIGLGPIKQSDVVVGVMSITTKRSVLPSTLRIAAIDKKALPRNVLKSLLRLLEISNSLSESQDIVCLVSNDEDLNFLAKCLYSLEKSGYEVLGDPSNN